MSSAASNGRSTGNPTLTHHGGRTRADEEQPLLGRKPAAPSVVTRFRNSLMSDVRRDWADVVLLFCYLITGLLDSSSISMWGSFVSMQTGMPLIIAYFCVLYIYIHIYIFETFSYHFSWSPVEADHAHRKHGLSRSGAGSAARVDAVDQVGHIAGMLLYRVLLVQPLPPPLLATASLGHLCLLRNADGPDARGRHYRHDSTTAARQPGAVLERARAHCAGRLASLRTSGLQQSAQVQRPDQCGPDEHLL